MTERLNTKHPQRRWQVLLIGGASGVGKTQVARQLGLQLGVAWMQVDDIRLAFQYSQVSLPQPQASRDLYFFTETPDIWQQPVEVLRDHLIATGRILQPALEIIIANHIDTNAPLIIEGDGILPELLARPKLTQYQANGQLQAVFLYETEKASLHSNIEARGRGTDQLSTQEIEHEAEAKWLYDQWLRQEAYTYKIPTLPARPWNTLPERMVETVYRPATSTK